MLYQAELAATMLRAHGINAQLPDRNLANANALLLNAMGGVRVTVPDAQIGEARRLLADAEWSVVGDGAESDEWMEEATPGKVGELDEGEIRGALGGVHKIGKILVIAVLIMPLAGCLLVMAFGGR
jgi:hypothetical protein